MKAARVPPVGLSDPSASNTSVLIRNWIANPDGGRRDATRIRVSDFGDSHGDELLRQVRKKLRRDYGFAKGEGNHYGIPCVSTQEQPVFPWADGTCALEPEPGSNLRLDCATGFGTAVFITGAFGFAAASARSPHRPRLRDPLRRVGFAREEKDLVAGCDNMASASSP